LDICPVAITDADEKLVGADADSNAVNNSNRAHIASKSKAWDVSIHGFPGYVLTSE
jgi:hypothetical protein